MSSSQPLITPELFGLRVLSTVLAAMVAAVVRLSMGLRSLTYGDGQQASMSAAGPWDMVSIRAGRWPRAELAFAPWIAGRGRRTGPAVYLAGQRMPYPGFLFHHCRVDRLGQQAVDINIGRAGGRWA
jgi:hypothetical protein